jgi:uncharacterized protein (DUF1800 family)
MVKPPVVFLASILRRLGRYIDTDAWIPFSDLAGQVLFRPPNVSGWNDDRWLDTSRMRGRWRLVELAVRPTARRLNGLAERPQTAEAAVTEALRAWGKPQLRPEHSAELLSFADRAMAGATPEEVPERMRMRTEGLLQLIGISPDLNLQ